MADWFDQTFDYSGRKNREADRQAELARMLSGMANQPTPQFQKGPSPAEIQATTQQMRDRRTLGDIYQASGDPALGGLGKTLSKTDPEKYAADQRRQNQVTEYQQWQVDNAQQNRKMQLMLKGMKDHSDENEALWRKIPATKMTEYETDHQMIRAMRRFKSTNAPHLTQSFGRWLKAEGWAGPLEGLPAWLTRYGFSKVPQEFRDQAQWWADIESDIIAPWRHGLYGATLTNNEKAAFRNMAMLEPGMDWEEVQKRLNNLHAARIEGARTRMRGAIMNYGGENPEGLTEQFQKFWSGMLDNAPSRSYEGGAGATTQSQQFDIKVIRDGKEVTLPSGAPLQQDDWQTTRQGTPFQVIP